MTNDVCGAPPQNDGEVYKPPPERAGLHAAFYLPINGSNRLSIYQRSYKTRVVHFSIEHHTLWRDEWEVVARIDSSRSVHFHLWNQHGRVLVDHREIAAIPPSPEGQIVVHNEYDPAWERLERDWRENLRRWIG